MKLEKEKREHIGVYGMTKIKGKGVYSYEFICKKGRD